MSLYTWTVLYILTLHWIADFILQTHWQATNKSKSVLALTKHVFSYTLALFVGMFIFFAFVVSKAIYGADWTLIVEIALRTSALYALLNGSIHWATDYVTSKVTASLWKQGEIHDFFVMVGFDQLLHYITLFVTYFWFIGV